jgi:hypothetical protein
MRLVVESSLVWLKLLKDIASNSNGSVIWYFCSYFPFTSWLIVRTSEGLFVSGHREELEFSINGCYCICNTVELSDREGITVQ